MRELSLALDRVCPYDDDSKTGAMASVSRTRRRAVDRDAETVSRFPADFYLSQHYPDVRFEPRFHATLLCNLTTLSNLYRLALPR
jgi:hypothetical protein